jgi:hypothetical protein
VLIIYLLFLLPRLILLLNFHKHKIMYNFGAGGGAVG